MPRTLLIQAMFFLAVIALMAAVTVSQVALVDGGYARAARTGLILDGVAIVCMACCFWMGRIWTRVGCSALLLVAVPLLLDCIRRGLR